MAEIDPVILELIARNDRYLAELRKTTRVAEQQMGAQERRVKRLETEMARSSQAIGGQFRRLAGIFATAFSARQVQQLADGYTRFTNQLQVAGLEGRALADTQEQLFGIAQRYGVELESLGTLFSRGAQVSKELGASQAELVQFTEGVAAALKIQGSSASQAQGALLQLSQALGSGTVRAEEFNSINEGALPILQAVARNLDAAGGSVARLKQLVIEGEVSSDQFFRAFLAGSQQLQQQAERASLTIGASFTALNNALGKYIGETDDALSATERISQAIILLSENIDTVVSALAVLGTVMLGRYVAGMAAGGVATRALAAHLSIATTSLAGTALAARSAGAALLAAFGGPVGIAVTALVLGIGYLVTRTDDAREATGRFKAGLDASNKITDKARELAEKLATARGKERDATLEALRVEKARAQQALISAKNDIIAARAALARARAVGAAQDTASGSYGGAAGVAGAAVMQNTGRRGVSQAQANLAAAEQAAKNIEAGLEQISAIISGASGGVAIPAAGDGKASKARKNTGPTAADIASRFEAELVNYTQQSLGAMQQVARSAEERADLEMRSVEWARRQTLKEIAADTDYNAAQKAELSAAVERLAQYERDAVEFEKRRQLEQEAQDLAEEEMRNRDDRLRLAYDLATTEAERRSIALQILDAEDAYLRSKLEAVIASETATKAEQERARIALAGLESTAQARRDVVARQHQGPLGRYLDSTSDPQTMAEEAAVRELEAVRDGLAEGLAEELGIENDFIKSMLSIFLDQNLFRPIAEALRNGGNGGGLLGGVVSGIAAIFGGGGVKSISNVKGFAGGGSMVLGGRGGTDTNLLSLNGQPIARVTSGEALHIDPNPRLGGASTSGVATVRLMLSGDIDARIQRVSGPVAVEVVRASAPALIDASAAETVRRTSRPRM